MNAAHDQPVILVAEDDAGHAHLIQKNLRRTGLTNRIERFADGQQTLDFLFGAGERRRQANTPYLLLLDIRMPKVDGVEVLRRMKADPEVRKLPVTMLTTTDDPLEVDRCYRLGCNSYMVKPLNYEKFAEAIENFASLIPMLEVPSLQNLQSVNAGP